MGTACSGVKSAGGWKEGGVRGEGEESLQTGSTATEPGGRREGGGGHVSNLTDHSFNSGENTVMAHRQTVTDTGGSRSRR